LPKRPENWHNLRTTSAHFPAKLGPWTDANNTTLLMGRKLNQQWSFRPINIGVMRKSHGSVTGSMG
jgi:hypothetical protein